MSRAISDNSDADDEPNDRCIDCSVGLTFLEYLYYLDRCEACEGKWQARIEAWRGGALDKELDELYGA